MASPPNHSSLSAFSPPHPSNAQLPSPLKRRQSEMPSSGPAGKRRKASMMSNASAPTHPLRQTSFPPENASGALRFSRSPSMDTMSLASGVSGKKAKKRPRPSKDNDDNKSIAGGRAKSVMSKASDRGKCGASREYPEEDEEDDDAGDTAVEMANNLSNNERTAEHQAALVVRFDENQTNRYDTWRSAKFPDPVTRRIVNQTLSQSAPANVILAIRSIAKIFAGEIIEGAVKVQRQWDESDAEAAGILEKIEKDTNAKVCKEKETFPRGPLGPEHLRESLRRFQAAGVGNFTGQLGLWQTQQKSGVERFGVKLRGRRLFK